MIKKIKGLLIITIMRVFRLKAHKLDFVFRREIYDKDLTLLAFLNKSKAEFTEQAESFISNIDKSIEEIGPYE